PTGSGKTTTLYTTLQSLATEEVNVTTVEDPIEMVTDSFNQVMVQSKAGLSFAAALRTVLRQDPDIIMLGEIRDPETAEMAVQAALTGHLVFATLHTNDSVGAIARLRDLKVPSFLIASVLAGVMAQRLVRKVCPHCSSERMPDAAEQALIGDPSIETIVVGEGCRKCRGTGYLGRIGVFEMFDVDDGARRIIAKETGEAALRAHANSRGMRGLRECSMARLADKSRTLAEVMRVSGESEHNWALDDEANEEVVQHGTEGNE
ncbi:Flp pilus assembly complex ATPase component TadA, partial [Myxococcota bacterium]|nr:Flp pilus assembly complex ATPase component TadA [Myxococcota bacterium]